MLHLNWPSRTDLYYSEYTVCAVLSSGPTIRNKQLRYRVILYGSAGESVGLCTVLVKFCSAGHREDTLYASEVGDR